MLRQTTSIVSTQPPLIPTGCVNSPTRYTSHLYQETPYRSVKFCPKSLVSKGFILQTGAAGTPDGSLGSVLERGRVAYQEKRHETPCKSVNICRKPLSDKDFILQTPVKSFWEVVVVEASGSGRCSMEVCWEKSGLLEILRDNKIIRRDGTL